jgi:ArsR family transcriptional regulator, arsenate/arsenite/antimonite-responsive transcriptional repressor
MAGGRVEDSQATSRETVRVLAALSDENRFRIVSLLAGEEGELSCGAISKALELSPSLLSHHLSILADAGIIGRRKNGRWTMNALERPVIERQLAALDSLIGRNGNGAGEAVGAAPVDAPGAADPSDDGVTAGS